VPTYRMYTVNREGRILAPAQVVECADDREAIRRAQPLVNGHDIEIWRGARVVRRLISDAESAY
jgi:hypothetical protein